MDVAQLGVSITPRGIRETTDQMNKMAGAAGSAERSAKQFAQEAGKQFAVVSAAATAMGVAIYGAAMRGARAIDDAAKAARRLDASIAAYRGLALAADEAGVSMGALTNDVQSMARELSNIGVSGNADRALNRLGITLADLQGLDVDEKMATIADQVNRLGLSSGETTAILRDLGVRNREMALLFASGGDAIRGAVADIQDYGLAISEVDANRIEAANDAIGRLGLVTQYAGQRLAMELVPALGQLSTAITDSLREGGLLRAMIDGLADNIQRIIFYMGTAVTMFGVRYVAAVVLARVATMTLSGALVVLRGALIRTGIGALIVGAGELVYQFTRLVQGAGGFGNAMTLMGNVGKAVWQELGQGGEVLFHTMASVATRIAQAFVDAFNWVLRSFGNMIDRITGVAGVQHLFDRFLGIQLPGSGDIVGGTLSGVSDSLGVIADNQMARAGLAASRMSGTQAALDELRAALSNVDADAGSATEAAARFNGALNDLEGGAGGAASAAAAAGEEFSGLGDAAIRAAEDTARFWRDTTAGFMRDLQSGLEQGKGFWRSFGDAAVNALQRIADTLLSQVLDALFQVNNAAGGGGGFLSGLLGAFGIGGGGGFTQNASWAAANAGFSFEGGGFTGYGPRTGGIDGRGGFNAILHPNETIIDHTRRPHNNNNPPAQNQNGGKSVVELRLSRDVEARILKEAGDQTVQIVQQGFDEFARGPMQNGIEAYMRDPARRG